MCGIVGWYGPKPDKAIVKKMNDRISHRGPDSSGIFADDNVCLAMRRLAIIDLSPKGNQPMTSTTGKTTIVFNGEIYNFAELRPRIRNYKFRSGSDTEIILALYEQEGEACVKLLRGMFAFAIYDHDKKTLFIARDRLGKKPLYYYHDGKALLFASELKALLVHPLLASRTVNQIAVSQYLRFGYVPDPLSIFTQVCKLPPAHTLTATKEGITVKEYWDLDFNSKTTMTMQQAEERIRQLVDESVKLRMIADVPIGAFLSGGIDSSVVVAHMARHSQQPVKTFSIGFGEARYNELDYAKLVAEKFNTDHHEIIVKPDFIKDMPGIMKFYDEPFADASAIPTFYVARETRRHVTVALNGDGGDENFAGYARYVHGMRSRLLRIPPIPQAPLPRTGIARKFELLATNNEKRFFSLNSAFEGHMDNASLPQSFRTFYAKPKKLLDKWLYTDIKTYLPGDLLTKVDIATMANSLEGRSPLLDHKLMEFTASLDPAWKLQGVNTKVIFKRAMKNIVPKEILTKPKQGFAVPINEWMQGEFHDQASAELLGKSNLLETLPRDRITKMLELQKQGKPYGFRLWNLLMLRQWEKSYCE